MNKLFEPSVLKAALVVSFQKLDPRLLFRNPVMFLVEMGAVALTLMALWGLFTGRAVAGDPLSYQWAVAGWLWITVWFGAFAEAIAEARGKAQASSLRRTREQTSARKLLPNGETLACSSIDLQPGDLFVVEAGEVIPADGEVTSGMAYVDESAITGESAPVVREAGGDRSGVTGGTRVLSDRLVITVTSAQGDSFLDKMIALVEGANRKKSPNEIALSLLLTAFTLVFLLVIFCLPAMGRFLGASLSFASLAALFVCLIPTTIGALLSAIGIAGMDRSLRARVIAKSGKAVEAAGDVDTLLLDKTGTITLGNRRATAFFPVEGVTSAQFAGYALAASLADTTPEGQSVVELARGMQALVPEGVEGGVSVAFSAETRASGIDLAGGMKIRKGAVDAIRERSQRAGLAFPGSVQQRVIEISGQGGTPLVLAVNDEVKGVIQLQDVIKPGISQRFERLRKMGVKTVMITGDNPLTAAYIAREAGVDDFVAEAKPEDKMNYIRQEQALGKMVAMMGDGTNDAPALAQADVGVAMNSGTQAAKEAANMVDLDNEPTKLIEVIEIGKQMLITRGALTTFSIANDVAKYFAIVPALFSVAIPGLNTLNVMQLESPQSAILSALIFNALIIPLLLPLALKGVTYRPVGAEALLSRNLLVYGLGGIVSPFAGIKLIDLFLHIF